MTILVTGSTGSVGRLVALECARAGVPARALTVDPLRAAIPEPVTTVTGNIREPETLGDVLEGVERMYLAPAPETVERVVEMAVAAGVRHIVDLSGEPESWWHSVAATVEASGVAWTHLWPGEFMENSTIWADQIRAEGVVRDAFPDSADAPIAVADIAAVASAILIGGGHENLAYPMPGPQTLTSAERVALIGKALGVDIPFIEVSRDEAVRRLETSMGEYAAWYVDGRAELVGLADGPDSAAHSCPVELVTGRPATTFADWARLNADRFR